MGVTKVTELNFFYTKIEDISDTLRNSEFHKIVPEKIRLEF